MKKIIITSIAISISSCAIVSETYMPDGSKGYSISCDGAAVGINVCFEKAGSICGSSGYDLITREGQVVPFTSGSAAFNSYGGAATINQGAFNTKSIMIKCKQPNQQAAQG